MFPLIYLRFITSTFFTNESNTSIQDNILNLNYHLNESFNSNNIYRNTNVNGNMFQISYNDPYNNYSRVNINGTVRSNSLQCNNIPWNYQQDFNHYYAYYNFRIPTNLYNLYNYIYNPLQSYLNIYYLSNHSKNSLSNSPCNMNITTISNEHIHHTSNNFCYNEKQNNFLNGCIENLVKNRTEYKKDEHALEDQKIFGENLKLIDENKEKQILKNIIDKKERLNRKNTSKYNKTRKLKRNIILKNINYKKINILKHYDNYSADDIKSLILYSSENIDLDKISKEFKVIQSILSKDQIEFIDKINAFYNFIINCICEYNQKNHPVLKKSFILLTFNLCELIPFINFFTNNYKNLFKMDYPKESLITNCNDMAITLTDLIKVYHNNLNESLLCHFENIKNLDPYYILKQLKLLIYNQTMKFRYSLVKMNKFLTGDTRILIFYSSFVDTIYKVDHGSHADRIYEILLFYSYLIDSLDTKRFFKNTKFKDKKCTVASSSIFKAINVSKFLAYKYIIEQFSKDYKKFCLYLNDNYFKYGKEINHEEIFEYITTNKTKIYLTYNKTRDQDINEIFYTTSCNYVMSFFHNIFLKLIKYALNCNN